MKQKADIKSIRKPNTTSQVADRLSPTRQSEKGSVTAELAVALPAVVLLLFTVLAIAAAFGTQMRVSDAARIGARLYAIGAPTSEIEYKIKEIAGPNAISNIPKKDPYGIDEWTTISVKRMAGIGPANIGIFTLSASATVWIEP